MTSDHCRGSAFHVYLTMTKCNVCNIILTEVCTIHKYFNLQIYSHSCSIIFLGGGIAECPQGA